MRFLIGSVIAPSFTGLPGTEKDLPRLFKGAQLFTQSVTCALCMIFAGCANLAPLGNSSAPHGIQQGTQRGVAQYIQDQTNQKKVLDALYQTDPRFSYARIQPHVFRGVLLLTGQVPDAYMAPLAIDVIQQKSNVTGVTLIHNYLSVDEKPSYQQIAQDDYISNTVKKGAYALEAVTDKSVYITTQKATLFVMGMVTETNANAIVTLAQQTPGVVKVVMLVDIIKAVQPVIPVAKAIPVMYSGAYVAPSSGTATESVAIPPSLVGQSPIITTQSSLKLQGSGAPSSPYTSSAMPNQVTSAINPQVANSASGLGGAGANIFNANKHNGLAQAPNTALISGTHAPEVAQAPSYSYVAAPATLTPSNGGTSAVGTYTDTHSGVDNQLRLDAAP